jgi:L-histidine Nalpha-methyltransferase
MRQQSAALIEVPRKTDGAGDFAADVLRGLSANPKRLDPIYFYDAEGSLLFERLCRVPEYYVTRTERGILERCVDEIAACSLGEMHLIEFGSGSSEKTRLLIDALLRRQGELCYIPIDISPTVLLQSARRLLGEYPHLSIAAQAAEYNEGLSRLASEDPGQKLIAFMGSNLGNFDPTEGLNFLTAIRNSMGEDDYLMIGNDLAKDESVLVPAYDDAQGITAAFNLNILHRINRELGAKFEVSHFSHMARYNRDEGRIEMHLKCNRRETVPIQSLGMSFHFEKGETIHTENSYKYTLGQLGEIFRKAGFKLVKRWLDDLHWFSVSLLGISRKERRLSEIRAWESPRPRGPFPGLDSGENSGFAGSDGEED